MAAIVEQPIPFPACFASSEAAAEEKVLPIWFYHSADPAVR